MKRYSTNHPVIEFFALVLTSICFFTIGCKEEGTFQDNTTKNITVKGVLTEVDDYEREINGIFGWKTLYFKDGGSVMAHVGPGDALYINHYQEIELDNQGMVINVKCESYEKLVGRNGYQDYKPTDDLLSENKGLVVERGGGR